MMTTRTIFVLPGELLTEIFGFVTDPQDLCTLSCVCQQMNEWIEPAIYRDIAIFKDRFFEYAKTPVEKRERYLEAVRRLPKRLSHTKYLNARLGFGSLYTYELFRILPQMVQLETLVLYLLPDARDPLTRQYQVEERANNAWPTTFDTVYEAMWRFFNGAPSPAFHNLRRLKTVMLVYRWLPLHLERVIPSVLRHPTVSALSLHEMDQSGSESKIQFNIPPASSSLSSLSFIGARFLDATFERLLDSAEALSHFTHIQPVFQASLYDRNVEAVLGRHVKTLKCLELTLNEVSRTRTDLTAFESLLFLDLRNPEGRNTFDPGPERTARLPVYFPGKLRTLVLTNVSWTFYPLKPQMDYFEQLASANAACTLEELDRLAKDPRSRGLGNLKKLRLQSTMRGLVAAVFLPDSSPSAPAYDIVPHFYTKDAGHTVLKSRVVATAAAFDDAGVIFEIADNALEAGHMTRGFSLDWRYNRSRSLDTGARVHVRPWQPVEGPLTARCACVQRERPDARQVRNAYG